MPRSGGGVCGTYQTNASGDGRRAAATNRAVSGTSVHPVTGRSGVRAPVRRRTRHTVFNVSTQAGVDQTFRPSTNRKFVTSASTRTGLNAARSSDATAS